MHKPQLKVAATYMRGGTSKGVFFKLDDLPCELQKSGRARDQFLLRMVGSPDPYGKQTDGMGGATSSTSKAVIVSKSKQDGHDVDYLFGQISIDKPVVDWSGNCGNLTAAVGAFAITSGLIEPGSLRQDGIVKIRIWQVNIGKTIIAHIPIVNGQVQESGDFELDGVTFASAEVAIEFINPGATDSPMFPTGNIVDQLVVPEIGSFNTTLINAGIPILFLNAADLGYQGTELQPDINTDKDALKRLEIIRAYGALKMGLIDNLEQAQTRQHTPKIAFVAPPKTYIASSGKEVMLDGIDLNVRALSMGQLHHAMMGTAAVAIATAASIEGTIVNLAAGGGELNSVCFGHPSGTLRVGAETDFIDGRWQAKKALMSRSARVLMEGWVRVPSDCF